MPKVVVIDESPADCLTLMYALEESGYKVESAGTFADGLALIAEFQPDLVTIEVAQSSGQGYHQIDDGLETIRQIKELRPSIPIIVITVIGDQGSLSAIKESAADKLITKPFHRNKLPAAIRDLIGE